MIFEILLAALGGSALSLGGVFAQRKWKERQDEIWEGVNVSFLGLNGGVWIHEKNGSRTALEAQLFQRLVECQMTLYTLNQDAAQNLAKDGVWSSDLGPAGVQFDVIVTGYLHIKQLTLYFWHYPTRQHIDTETGRRFDELSLDQGGRKKNSVVSYSLSPGSASSYQNKYYFEPQEEFAARQEREKYQQAVPATEYTADIRFHGPGGQILGACVLVEVEDFHNQGAVDRLTDKILRKLAATVHEAQGARDVAETIASLKPPQLEQAKVLCSPPVVYRGILFIPLFVP